MSASKQPSEFRMEGVMFGGEVYVRERDCRAGMQRAMALNGNNVLLASLRDLVSEIANDTSNPSVLRSRAYATAQRLCSETN